MPGVANIALAANGPVDLTSYEPAVSSQNTQEVDSRSSSRDGDTFESIPLNQEQAETTTQGFFQRLFGRVISSGRRFWKSVRKYNPFTQFLNLVENIRCRPHVQRAASRNGATTDAEIKEYHESLNGGIFRSYLGSGNSSRPAVILFLGNGQTLDSPENEAGVLRLAERLRRDRDVDVLVFRVGCAKNELRHRFCLSNDCSLHTSVVYQHSTNIIEDYVNGRGMFAGRRPPSRVVFGGFSFGGGTIDRLLNQDWRRIGGNIPVAGSVYIDAVTLGSYDLGDGVEQRPPHSQQHLNFYQRNSVALNGNHLRGARPNDVSVPVSSTNHSTIDDDDDVQNRAYRFIRGAVIRN